MKVTGSLVVCFAAACFTTGALVVNSDDATPSPAAVASAAAAPAGVRTAQAAQAQIDIQGFAFSATGVAPGGTVVVVNRDSVAHTVSATDGSFGTGKVAGGRAVTIVAPRTPGAYQFVCSIHPSMHGQLVVG